ncbi:uncharacterized protein LOC131047198 isoform X1 [Cryptomeria japonica]|uniref:uncharacterized protein LOC131047198 isoform X1 n=1 Tax=Cryptomeria japonica TaxID=3369 RepID=UPI0027DA862C|nr:uncharacterized protein LOC131047198 isoform X1 [Cryptomeria japonica]
MARDTFRAEEDIIFLSCLIAFGSMMNWHAESLHEVLQDLKMKVKTFMDEQEEENSEQEEDEDDFITMEFGAKSPDHSSPQNEGANLAQSPDDHSTSPLIIQAGGVAPYHPLHNPCAPRPTFLRYGKNSPGFSIHKLRPIVDIQRSEEESRAKAESEAEAETEADQGYNGEKSQVNEDYVNESHGPQLAQDSPSLEDQESKQPNDTTEPNPNSLLLLAHRINTSTVGFKSCRSVIRKMMLPLFMLLVLVTVTVTSGFDLLVLDNNYLGSSIVHHHSAHMNNPLPLTERVSLSQKIKGFFFLLQQSEEREKENRQTVRQSSTATLALVQEIRKVEQMQDEIGEDASRVFHLQELKQAEEREDNLATENGENAGLSWPDSGCNASQYLSQDLKDDTKILLKSAIEPELKQCNELKDHTIEVDSSDFRTSLSEVNRQSHLAGNEMIKSDVWGHAHCLETFEEHHHGGLNRLQSKDSLSSKVVCQLQRDCDEIPRIAELKKNEEIRLPDRDCLPHSKSDGAVEVLAVAGCDVKKEILSTPSKGEKRTSGEMNSKINCSNGEVCQDEIGEDASRVLEIACLRLAQSGLNHDAAETIAFVGKLVDSSSSYSNTSKTATADTDQASKDETNQIIQGNSSTVPVYPSEEPTSFSIDVKHYVHPEPYDQIVAEDEENSTVLATVVALTILLILVAGGNRWRKAQEIEVTKRYSRNKPRKGRQQIEQTVFHSTIFLRRSYKI